MSDAPEVRVSLKSMLMLAGIQFASTLYGLYVAATLFGYAFGFMVIPLLMVMSLQISWFRQKDLPLGQRYTMALVSMAALVWMLAPHGADAFSMLSVVLPIIMFGTVGALLLTTGRPWPVRRTAVLVVLLGSAAVLTLVRVDGARGNLAPFLAWRWAPTAEALMAESVNPDDETQSVAEIPDEISDSDWTSFRGPGLNSQVPGVSFATNWDESAPDELWRRRVGIGWSSFTVVGDYFYTQEQRGEEEATVCYRVADGTQVWIHLVPGRYDESNGGGPRATPTYQNGDLFVLGALGTLQRLDAASGEVVWTRELTKDSGAAVPQWGFTSSPMIVDDLLYVFAGGPAGKSVLAYTWEDGELAWHAGDGTHGYSTVHLTEIDGVAQLVVPSDVGIQSFVPETGELLWEHLWTAMSNPRCVQPIIEGNAILIGTAGNQGTRRIDVSKSDDGWQVEEGWTTRKFRPYFNDAVLHNGFAYGFDGRAFGCFDVETGERKWRASSRFGGQVLLVPDMDLLLVLAEDGQVILMEAQPDEPVELAKIKAIDGKTWNHPVIANGKLFVRNSEEAACFQLPMPSDASV